MTKKLIDDPFLTKKGSLVDLGVGNPAFMFDYWHQVKEFFPEQSRTVIDIDANMSYDYEQTQILLKEAIKKLHDSIGNAVTDGYEVVLGNGAAHMVSAWAYSTDLTAFHVNTPHWPRLVSLAKMGSVFAPGDKPAVGQLVVIPNNPDNDLRQDLLENTSDTAYDLCYNWPQYTEVKKYEEDVMIFGLAKATGHAGTRLGWALVKDHDQAIKMAKYIEISTSGVSQEAQIRGHQILTTIFDLDGSYGSCFKFGKETLDRRWSTFLLLSDGNPNFEVLNKSGMFAWCRWKDRGADAALEVAKRYKAHVIGGESFGADKSYFRISLGCYEDDYLKFILSLKEPHNA